MGLFIRPEKTRDFGAEKFDERARQHLLMLLCVFKVVLWMSQHIKECLDQFLVLQGKQTEQPHYLSGQESVLKSMGFVLTDGESGN